MSLDTEALKRVASVARSRIHISLPRLRAVVLRGNGAENTQLLIESEVRGVRVVRSAQNLSAEVESV